MTGTVLGHTHSSTANFGPRPSLDATPTPTLTPTSPVPTFHSLANLRFPPGTPPSITSDYEEICRELFAVLGKRPELGEDIEMSAFHLAQGIGVALEGLAQTLDSGGLVGPLISLFSLISHLVLLFSPFTLYFLNDPHPSPLLRSPALASSKLLSLLARIIKRFGRPTPVVRAVDNSGKGKARERSRRVRGVVTKPQVVQSKEQDERVELEPGKRSALLLAVMEILEGLAWRATETSEEQ
jgi:hypothetical protein